MMKTNAEKRLARINKVKMTLLAMEPARRAGDERLKTRLMTELRFLKFMHAKAGAPYTTCDVRLAQFTETDDEE